MGFRQHRKSGILVVAIALVVVCGWWAIVGPRLYRLYKGDAKAKEKLEGIQSPAGTKLLRISTSHLIGLSSATADYSTDWDCNRVKTYYKAELFKLGFTVSDEYKSLESQPKPDSILFTAPEYHAGLSCWETGNPPQFYTIILTRNNARD
jgi:hypothetical protein